MAKILWLSGEYLLPADSGLYRYSLDMMDALAQLGHELHAIGRRRETGTPTAVDGWTLLDQRRPPMWQKMLHVNPVKVVDVWDDDYRIAVLTAIDTFKPDVALFDHLRTGAALDLLKERRVPAIYVSQNDETMVKEKMVAAATGIRKVALMIDARKMKHFEDRLLAQCEGVSAISRADIDTFSQDRTAGPIVHTLPTYRGARIDEREITAETPRRLAMISTLYWGAKIDNMVMALEGLQPAIDDGVEVLVFTGGYPPPDEIMAQYPTVRFEGFVDDFDAALAECRMGVVFEPVGGGFKMKTLDFIFHRVPLITGDTSAESLPLVPDKSVVQVGSGAELGDKVLALIDDIAALNDLQHAAFDSCADLFTFESARPLSELVDRIAPSSNRDS